MYCVYDARFLAVFAATGFGPRIDFYNDYRPWESGTPLKYESYFREEARVGDSKPD
jgi:hypothetical protein